MLNVYFDYSDCIDTSKVVRNIEEVFSEIADVGTPDDKYFIEHIDKGKLADNLNFYDRFGRKLPNTELSTGCKVAISVSHRPDIIIDTQECGNNARDIILSHLKNGKIILHYNGVTLRYRKNAPIDVCINNKYRIKSLERLDTYLENEIGLDEFDDTLPDSEILK
jgi:hypothetical protein